MQVLKTYLFIDGLEDGRPFLIDTINHDGCLWLVSSWLQSNDTGERIPERLVKLTGLRFQEVEGKPYQFLLNQPLPKAVLEGSPVPGYELKRYPSLGELDGPKSKH